MNRAEEAAELASVRTRHQSASTGWQRGMTPAGEGLLASLIPGQEPTPVFLFDPWTDRNDIEFALHAHADIDFLLGLVDRAIARFRREAEAERREAEAKDFAANCAMYCDKPAFQRWLHEVHGLDHPWDSHRAATKVRFLLGIGSRADLNTDPAAAERWKKMRADFEKWRKMR